MPRPLVGSRGRADLCPRLWHDPPGGPFLALAPHGPLRIPFPLHDADAADRPLMTWRRTLAGLNPPLEEGTQCQRRAGLILGHLPPDHLPGPRRKTMSQVLSALIACRVPFWARFLYQLAQPGVVPRAPADGPHSWSTLPGSTFRPTNVTVRNQLVVFTGGLVQCRQRAPTR